MKKGFITATLIVLSLGVGTVVGAKLERSKIQESNKSALNENINELNNENKSGEKETLVNNTSYNQKISARKAIENLKYTDNGDCNIREYETIKEGYNFNIDSLMKYEGISIKDKENIVKLVNELPICKLGKVTDVEIGLNSGKNMIRIKFNFNNEFNNLDMEYLSCLLSKNSFAIQSLIPEADLVDFTTNIYGLTCGYDAFEEAMSNII